MAAAGWAALLGLCEGALLAGWGREEGGSARTRGGDGGGVEEGRWIAHGFGVPRYAGLFARKGSVAFGGLDLGVGIEDFVVEEAGLVKAVGDPARANCGYGCGTRFKRFAKL